MPDDDPHEQTQHSKRWMILAALPFLYVLSYGPAAWIVIRFKTPAEILATTY